MSARRGDNVSGWTFARSGAALLHEMPNVRFAEGVEWPRAKHESKYDSLNELIGIAGIPNRDGKLNPWIHPSDSHRTL
jgi:hypothetical protein